MSKANAAFFTVVAAGLLMAGCGGGGGGGTAMPTTVAAANPAPAAAADVMVTISGMSFSPSAISVQVGQTVAWKNADGVAHTATQDGGGFDTGTIAPGATSAPIMMSTAGTLKYHCTIHPSMVATVSVGVGGSGY